MKVKELSEEERRIENEKFDAQYQERKVSLYDILDAERELEGIEDAEEYTQALEVQKENKVNGTVKYIRQLETWADGAEAEAQRLLENAKVLRKRVEGIKKWIAYSMQANDILKIETGFARVSFRKSQRVEVDESMLVYPYIQKISKMSVNKKLIVQELKQGKEIQGATLITNQNLVIK